MMRARRRTRNLLRDDIADFEVAECFELQRVVTLGDEVGGFAVEGLLRWGAVGSRVELHKDRRMGEVYGILWTGRRGGVGER
jgi:hypothetical protein